MVSLCFDFEGWGQIWKKHRSTIIFFKISVIRYWNGKNIQPLVGQSYCSKVSCAFLLQAGHMLSPVPHLRNLTNIQNSPECRANRIRFSVIPLPCGLSYTCNDTPGRVIFSGERTSGLVTAMGQSQTAVTSPHTESCMRLRHG